MNSAVYYRWPAVTLHWLAALLIIGGFALGLSMVDLPFSPQRIKYYSWHKWIGISVWLLAVLRLLWRLVSPPPPLLPMPAWQRRAATATHHLLYA
ncbi:MAG: cytochrome b, partial [Burkholderiales bacterium]